MGATASAVLALISTLISSGLVEAVVRMIERLLKGSTGAEKKAEAMRVLGEGLPVGAVNILSASVDSVVDEFNHEGIFKHRNR